MVDLIGSAANEKKNRCFWATNPKKIVTCFDVRKMARLVRSGGEHYVENQAEIEIEFSNLKNHTLALKNDYYIMGVSPTAWERWKPRFWSPEGQKTPCFGEHEGTHCRVSVGVSQSNGGQLIFYADPI